MENYVKALLDPFDRNVQQLKLLDGRENSSAGIRFRSVGSIVCDTAAPTFILLVPGLGNGLIWKSAAETTTHPAVYPDHVGSSFVGNIKKTRVVSVGLQLNLENVVEENEGYWEAVRVPVNDIDFTLHATDGTIDVADYTQFNDLSNFTSYQSGKLREIHRYQFKLNSTSDDHRFVAPTASGGPGYTLANFVDDTFDCVVIKIYGRKDVASPSVIRYDGVSNQEVVYKENTVMNRLLTKSERLPNFADILDKTDYLKPGIQIS